MRKKLYILFLCFGIVSSTAFAQDETDELADYKTACLAAIDDISKIGDNFAMRSMITVAKTSLNLCRTKDDMRRAMTALRAGVLGYLQTAGAFSDGQVFTGLVGNHSFDTGDLSLWYSIGFDLSQISLTDITSAISSGSVSGLVNAVKVNEWNENTKAVENQGTAAVQGGEGKYYLNSNQLLMQPILGLPAGIYSLSGKVACTPGFFNLTKVYLNALVVPTNIVQEVIGDVLQDTSKWGELLSNFDLTQYMAPFLQGGKLYSASVNCKNMTTLSDGELRFVVDEGDLLVIGMNAGMIPFIGTEQYRADDLQLIGLRAANGILSTAKADLEEALQGHAAIEANYNADAEGTATQPAFSYNKTITENYNSAYRTARDKYDNDKLADILTKSDLNNIDGLDATLKNYYSKDIQTLEKAKETFDEQAFIAPADDEVFNIVMKDDWISLLTSKWTGNAVSIDEDMSLRFSQKPGQSVFALAFGFERASETCTNQLRAFVNDYLNKYYLAQTDDKFVLTTDPSEAVTITAVPSYTEEGETKLMLGDMYVGTSNSSDALVVTNSGTLLRPTRTGLSVVPASEMEIVVNVPVGQNAATLMLPFDAVLPEGISAYTATGIGIMSEGLRSVGNEQSTSYIVQHPSASLHANIPYIIIASEGNYTFSGISHAIQPSYEEGLLTGRYIAYTTEEGNEYKLTEEDGFTVFQRMDGQSIAANECYLKCDSPNDIIFVSQSDAATGINSKFKTQSSDLIYDLCGREIINPQSSGTKLPRGLYITGGRKILK